MKRVHILTLSLVLLIAWFTYTPAAVNFSYNLRQLFLSEANTWTGTQTFNSIKRGVSEITSDGAVTEPYGIYLWGQTSAGHINVPTPAVGYQYRFCRSNTGGVSVFTNSGSIGKSGTTAYSHSSSDTDACMKLTGISGTSYIMTVESGTWSVK